MNKEKDISDFKGSVTLKSEEGIKFYGFVERLALNYIELTGLKEESYHKLCLTMYPYYYNNNNQIVEKYFIEIPILFIEKTKDKVYRFSFISLTDCQRQFLLGYEQAWKYREEKFHKSNKDNLNFELAFSIINPKLENLLSEHKIKNIYSTIIKKMHLEESIFNRLNLTRVYYGNEFCPRLIPTIQKLDFIFNKLENEQLDITVLTPTLYEEDTKKFKELLNFINKYGELYKKKIEVVFNNWGTYQIMKNMEYIQPILGRLLVKLRRDARFLYNENEVFKPYIEDLRSGDLDVQLYRDFLRKNNISQVEIDCMPQGIPNDLSLDSELVLHLHFPFYVMANSRTCILAAVNRDYKTMFDFKQPCKLECKNYFYDVSFIDKIRLVDERKAKISKSLIKGRALFSQFNNWKQEFDFQEAYQRNIKRIIFYHEIPY